MKTIEITPNYAAMFSRFKDCSRSALDYLSRKPMALDDREAIYEFISTFRVAFGSVTSQADIDALREMFDKGANAMFAKVEAERDAEYATSNPDGEIY